MSNLPDPAPLPRHPGEPAAPVPAEPPPVLPEEAEPAAWWHVPVGFVVLVCCLEAGEAIKSWSGLSLPGNILGLFLLLTLLGAGILPLCWVVDAARWLLWLLPLLFMPIFVYALRNRDFWVADRGLFAGTVAVATLLLWAATGHAAQQVLRGKPATGQPGQNLAR